MEYTYDAWGTPLSKSGSLADTLGTLNPYRYRGYIYDEETGLYYVSSRYYDPTVSRFINADKELVATTTVATPQWDKNLYAYCDNNPISRIDITGGFWESIVDVVTLGASIVEVCVNPTDLWAWACVAGDVVDLAFPIVTGIGEASRAIKTTVVVVDSTDDVVDAAKTSYKMADAADDIKKSVGSYEITYKDNSVYEGKGGFNRAITSAKEHSKSAGDVASIRWKSAPNSDEAFIDEYMMQKRVGGVLKSNPELNTHNKIWSPGRRYYASRYNQRY